MENGHETFRQLSPAAQERIEVILLPDSRSFPIAIETALKLVKGTKLQVCDAHGKVDCAICKKAGNDFTIAEFNSLPSNHIVVFDSLTQLTDSAIAHITRGKPDDYKLDYDDWGNLGKLLSIFLSHIQTAAYNVICISHETEVEMEDGKMKLVPTAGTRNFSRNTAKYFGHVVYCEVKTGKHKFTSSTTAIPNVIAGSRTNIQTEKMNEPSLAEIFGTNPVRSEPIVDSAVVTTTVSGTPSSVIARVEDTVHSNASGTDGKTNGEIAAGGLQALLARQQAARKGSGG